MLKRLTHLFLVISLLGQFLLTPAMALPDLLHTVSQNQIGTSVPSSSSYSSPSIYSNMIDSETADSETAYLQIAQSQQHKPGKSVQLAEFEPSFVLDCELFCQEVASGHCISHGSCAPGLHSFVSLALQINLESKKIVEPTWSVKTTILHIVNPPPTA